jgi:hypothetical protein
VQRNRRLVGTWDALSLALLLDWAPCTLESVPAASGTVDVALRDGTLDPWPFTAPRVALRCEGRRLAGRFDDEGAMRAALGAAPRMALDIELRAA